MVEDHFARLGFTLVPDVVAATECAELAHRLASGGLLSAGTRSLLAQSWCAQLAQRLRLQPALSLLLGESPVAVQCTYFEKSEHNNWLVALHQDLSIPVAERVSHPELRGWSEKEGVLFVQPPVAVLEHMVAIRIHLDDCLEADGPLRVVPGSHTHGRVAPNMGPRPDTVACVAARGAALAMRPLILHASSKSAGGSRRRVLHFVFGPATLPYGLQWHKFI